MYKLFNKTSTQPHHTLSRDQHAYQQNVIATTRVHSIMVSHWCRSSCRIMPLLMLLLIFLYHTMCPTQVQMEQCKQKSVTNTSSTTCFIATVFFAARKNPQKVFWKQLCLLKKKARLIRIQVLLCAQERHIDVFLGPAQISMHMKNNMQNSKVSRTCVLK